MGRDLAAAWPECKALFDKANEVLGYDLAGLCFNGPMADLTKTNHCQPAIFLVSAACLEAWKKTGAPAPAAVAGLSLGEWTALYAAGCLSFEDTLRVLAARGRLMQEACDATKGAMLSLIGLADDAVLKIAEQAGVSVANLNSPGQIVLSGAADAIAQAEKLAKEAGAKRALRLPVAGAYHSPLMQSAADGLRAVLAAVEFKAPAMPVISNVTGKPHGGPDEIRDLMVRQVTSSVQWIETVKTLKASGVNRYVEFGPGAVLTGLVKRMDDTAALANVSDVAALMKSAVAAAKADAPAAPAAAPAPAKLAGKLAGKTALVTGASRGIGKAIAVRLAAEGADVALVGRQKETLEETAAAVRALGRKALVCVGDVGRSEDAKKTVDAVVAELGRLDILVNNAGITKDGLLARMSDEDWSAVLDTNLKGAFAFMKAAARPMMKQESGAIVNVSSVIGLIGNAGQCNYAAAKGGLIALTKSAARELAPRHIRVNAVAPGFVETKMTEGLSGELKTRMLDSIPLKRFGSPEDIAGVVAFLAGEEAGYMTGQTVTVCGGLVMQ
jgi:3-oxoacyl-(acyl-carrier-protein) reductase/malonyl CoA-acyl carrier protein transacylase